MKTPISDEAEDTCRTCGLRFVHTDDARRLERQRDELAEALREMGDWLAYGLNKPDGAKPTAADYKRAAQVAAKGAAALAKVT